MTAASVQIFPQNIIDDRLEKLLLNKPTKRAYDDLYFPYKKIHFIYIEFTLVLK
jgi:hypothetical protein